jgi:hypothetical protein
MAPTLYCNATCGEKCKVKFFNLHNLLGSGVPKN